MVWTRRPIFILYQVCHQYGGSMFKKSEGDQERHSQIVLRQTLMFAALLASIHKTELPGDQVLEVVAACCLLQLLGQTAAVDK